MTKIINLRKVRKQRDRDARRAVGDGNAAKFGEAKDIRIAREAEADRACRSLEGHRLDDAPGDG